MLFRNIDHLFGLCNDARLIVTQLPNHVLEAKILVDNNARVKVLIPIIALIPSDMRLPFKFQMIQFSLMRSYAMTINKNQCQILSRVELLLKKVMFNHGQLYMVMSIVSNPKILKILLCSDSNDYCSSTTNFIYKKNV